MLTEITQVLLHFRRTCCAVNTNDIWLHCLQRRICSTNLGTHQHASGGFHGDLHLNGKSATTCRHCATTCLHCCLDLQQVHARFNQEKISATIDEAASLLFVGITQGDEINVTKAWQLCARSDTSSYITWAPIGFIRVGDAASDRSGGNVEFIGLV